MYATQQLDQYMDLTLKNFFIHGKADGTIHLSGFNPKDESHMALFQIAQLAHLVFGLNTTLGMPKLKAQIFIWKHKCHKFMSPGLSMGAIDCASYISEIETKGKVPGIFAQIYQDYYKKGSKK